MVNYYDVILATIPVLAMSGLALRTAIGVTGIGTGLLSAPLTPAGFLAASVLIVRELFFGPVATRSNRRRE